MRHETADAARRESSKTVEFFEIGALQQKLCLRDADAVHRVHCDMSLVDLFIYYFSRADLGSSFVFFENFASRRFV